MKYYLFITYYHLFTQNLCGKRMIVEDEGVAVLYYLFCFVGNTVVIIARLQYLDTQVLVMKKGMVNLVSFTVRVHQNRFCRLMTDITTRTSNSDVIVIFGCHRTMTVVFVYALSFFYKYLIPSSVFGRRRPSKLRPVTDQV